MCFNKLLKHFLARVLEIQGITCKFLSWLLLLLYPSEVSTLLARYADNAKSNSASDFFNWTRQTKGSTENSSKEKQRSEVTCPRSPGISHFCFCLPVHTFSLPGIKWVSSARHVSFVMSSQVRILILQFQKLLVCCYFSERNIFCNT